MAEVRLGVSTASDLSCINYSVLISGSKKKILLIEIR